jgi:hypothetical protein
MGKLVDFELVCHFLSREILFADNTILLLKYIMFSCILSLETMSDINSSVLLRKVGAAFFNCIDKKNTVDSIVIWYEKQLVKEAKP